MIIRARECCVLTVTEALRKVLRGNVRIFCLGNKFRRDDGVGSYVAERLSYLGDLIVNAELSLESYTREISEADTALLIDAVDFGGEPGDMIIRELSEIREELSRSLISFTHRVPLYLLSKISDKTSLVLAGVQPADMGFGLGLSSQVLATAGVLVEAIRRVITWQRPGRCSRG